ncbi:NAD(P)-dependent alcohol dehydrogenase [Palleronia sp. LCG004]|uniref:zinc-dependent alcohol dehydrogenase family protein n=1 Tax=Palleronia sp. LCG004 TaxID=3079304 RepID=UPI00294393A2|nr:NAD(P)-dependent alcohol dehydrogenase [Palleronia sp. LCG004]WOI58173.1 NAD(P)-dependent alcohol dehydrogenase [Palleronia sp. LCG004]
MKAIRVAAPGGLDRLSIDEIDTPRDPAPGEIRVQLKASSLNFHDYGVVSGAMKTEDGRIPMSDGAGVVEAVGDGVEFAPGDHVVSTFFPQWFDGPARIGDFSTTPGDGVDGYAREMVTAPATAFTRAPEGWSHEEAATITTAGLTAWRALIVDGGLKAGDDVLILGTGGVSIWALQIARAMGARVFATSSSDDKRAKLEEMGAAGTVNYRDDTGWGSTIREMTGGRGVDHVVEVGGPATLDQSIDAARIGGHLSLIGVLTGRGGEVPTAKLMAKQQRLQGLIVGSRTMQQDMVRAMERTGIRPVIDRSFPLTEIPDAFAHEESGKHFGKICLSI